MRFSLQVLLILVFNFYSIAAEAQWKSIGPFDRSVTSFFAPNDTLWAWCGNTIFKSNDNGSNWKNLEGDFPKAAPTKHTRIDSLYYSLVNGQLYSYSIENSNWKIINNPSLNPVIDFTIQIKESINILYATDGINIFYSGNRGVNWTLFEKDLENKPEIKSIGYLKNNFFALTQNSIYRTSNNEGSWSIDTAGLKNPLYYKFLKSINDTVFTVINGSEIYFKSQTETIWQKLTDTSFWDIQDIKLTKGYIFLTLNDNSLFSVDFGKSWNRLPNGTYSNFLESNDDYYYYINAGDNVEKVNKRNGQKEIISGKIYGTSGLNSIKKVKNQLFTYTYNNNVSYDDGQTFKLDTIGFSYNSLIFQHFILNDTVYVKMSTKVFRRSLNDTIWKKFQDGLKFGREGLGDFSSIGDTIFLESSTGINFSVLGEAWRKDTSLKANGTLISNNLGYKFLYFYPNISRADPGSKKWIAIGGKFPGNNLNVFISYNDLLFAGTNEGIYFSKDFGDSWNLADAGIYGYPITQIISDKENLFAGGGNKIFRSIDNGLHWIDVTYNLPSVAQINGFTGDSNYIFCSTENVGAFRLPLALFYPSKVILKKHYEITAQDAFVDGSVSINNYPTYVVLEYSKSNVFLPKDSILYYENPVASTTADLTFHISNLKENTLYYYRIKGINSAGVISYSEVRSFTTAKYLKIDHESSDPILITTVNIDAMTGKVSDLFPFNAGIILNQNPIGTKVKFTYRNFTEKLWNDSLITSKNNTYIISQPSTKFDELGLEYFFTVIPPYGYSSGVKSDTITSIKRVSLFYQNGLTFPKDLKTGNGQDDYNLISFPFDLIDKSSNGIVFPAVGTNKTDNTKFRFLTFVGSNGNYKDKWQENPENVVPGTGYWFSATNLVKPLNTGAGKTVANHPSFDGNYFKIPLSSGYTQIGNPYLYPVNWKQVLSTTGNSAISPLFGWVRNGDSTTLKAIDNLEVFSGGYVYNGSGQPLNLKIPVKRADNGNFRRAQSMEGSLSVALSLRNGINTFSLARFGNHAEASDQLDNYDIPAFNTPTSFPSLKFASEVALLVNILAETDTAQIWKFSATGIDQDMSTISWDIKNNAKNQQLWLHDLIHDIITNMRETDHYCFHGNTNFKIYAGQEEILKNIMIPSNAMLQIYPLPVLDKATIAFTIPDRDNSNEAIRVKIKLFDLSGQQVKMLEDNFYSPGFHNLEFFNNEEIAGVFTVGMEIGDAHNSMSKIFQKVFFIH